MKRIAAIFAVAAVSLTARAQNLNPTVEVTNIYEGAVTLADKPEAAMTVPDSVTVFNLDFDYSTFERPYMGAYDFTPYLIALKPSPSASSPSKLFVKAGAGFRLRPEAEIVWTPKVRGDFHPGVYASLDSYFGNYNKIVAKEGRLVPDGYFNGFDASVKAGTNGAWFFPRAIFSYDLHYNGIFTKDTLKMRPVNMAEGTVRLRSADGRPERFLYDAAFSYRFAKDSVGRQSALREHRFIFDSTFGYDLNDIHRFSLDTDVLVSDIGGLYYGFGGILRFIPKYRLEKGRWRLDAGVALSVTMGSGRSDAASPLYTSRGYQVVYPDVFIGFEAIRERMVIYAKVTGGDRLNSFSDIILANHFFSRSWLYDEALMDFSAERINAALGLRGNIGARFRYDLFGGYAAVKNDFLYGTDPRHSVVYNDHNLWYATLLCGWDSADFRADARFYIKKTNLEDKHADAFAPPVFSGSFKAEYVYMTRLAVGLDCSYATRMHSYGDERCTVPGWFDLGVIADFAVTRKFSIWARSGNLIGMNIQTVPFYSEKGRWGTLGIKFIL